MKREMAEMRKSLIVYSENDKVPTLRINDGKNEVQMNDTDLEERVTFLEFQMVNVNEELIDVENSVANVEGQITVIFSDQVIQDERLLELEQDMDATALTLEGHDNALQSLEDADNAVNASVEALDIRLERMELNGTIAFHAYLGLYDSVPESTVIVFGNVNVNIGNGYDGATGEFTVPPGGDGLYYLYGHFTGSGVSMVPTGSLQEWFHTVHCMGGREHWRR